MRISLSLSIYIYKYEIICIYIYIYIYIQLINQLGFGAHVQRFCVYWDHQPSTLTAQKADRCPEDKQCVSRGGSGLDD